MYYQCNILVQKRRDLVLEVRLHCHWDVDLNFRSETLQGIGNDPCLEFPCSSPFSQEWRRGTSFAPRRLLRSGKGGEGRCLILVSLGLEPVTCGAVSENPFGLI